MIGNENFCNPKPITPYQLKTLLCFLPLSTQFRSHKICMSILCNAKRKKKNLSNDDVNSNKDSSVSGMMCMRIRVRVYLGNRVEKYVILFLHADYSPISLNLLSPLSY